MRTKTPPKGKKPIESKKRKPVKRNTVTVKQNFHPSVWRTEADDVDAAFRQFVASTLMEMKDRIAATESHLGQLKLYEDMLRSHNRDCEPLASTEREEQWVPKMGDWVVVTGPAGIMGTDTFRGKVGHIKAYETTHNVSAWYVPELDAWFDASNIRLASPAEVQAYEEEQARAKQAAEEAKPLEFGTRVKVIEDGSEWRTACDEAGSNGCYILVRPTPKQGHMAAWKRRSEFTTIPTPKS